jgi:hypothetical protein
MRPKLAGTNATIITIGPLATRQSAERWPWNMSGKIHEKTDAVLREACGQHHDRHRSNDAAYHAEQGFAQRCAETWLIDDRRGSAGPVRIVEFEPEYEVGCEGHRCPNSADAHGRRRFWPAALLTEIPLSIPVVAAVIADGEGRSRSSSSAHTEALCTKSGR